MGYLCVAKNSLGESDGTIKLSERDAPPVIYTNPTPMSPPDDFKQLSSKEKEIHGKKYNVGNEKGYRETLQGRESNGNHNSFDEKALDTYSPFFQGQDSDEHIKEDTQGSYNGGHTNGRQRNPDENFSNRKYHINNGSSRCLLYSPTIFSLLPMLINLSNILHYFSRRTLVVVRMVC